MENVIQKEKAIETEESFQVCSLIDWLTYELGKEETFKCALGVLHWRGDTELSLEE